MTTAKKLILGFIAIFSFSNLSFGVTYTTLTNGAWNNTTNVWSLDGLTPCGCTPGATSAGNDIIINHNITTSYNLIFNGGSTVRINPTATLVGGDNISMWNSTIDFFGNANINKLTMGVTSVANLHTGIILNFSNQIQITNGIFTNDGGLTHSGGINVGAAGSIVLINSARMNVTSGNMTNYGTIDICGTCCMSSNGNWRNMASGNVIGTGAVNSGGNLQNSGTWDVNVSWCATGAGLGLPTPEDCATATGVCFAIVLPVEMVNFEANTIDNEYIALTWETVTESNSDYFIVERSTDGKEWSVIGELDAAGNSQSSIDYNFYDYEANVGENYYRLIQVDIDDRRFESKIVFAEINGKGEQISVYPNPAALGSLITVQNIQNGDVISIRNSAGNVAMQEEVNTPSGNIQLDISRLQPGMYFINTENIDKNTTVKLIVTR